MESGTKITQEINVCKTQETVNNRQLTSGVDLMFLFKIKGEIDLNFHSRTTETKKNLKQFSANINYMRLSSCKI